MTLKLNGLCALLTVLVLVILQAFTSSVAQAQPNLPDNTSDNTSNNASANAHQKVLDNVDPAIMAEVERIKAEQKARSDESRNNFASTSQGNGEVSLFVPPSIPVIVVVETDDGELTATEF